jgi:hypothetical protein
MAPPPLAGPVLMRLLSMLSAVALALALLVNGGCERAAGGAGDKAAGPAPIIGFDEASHDFGAVNEGPKVSHRFKVKNTGTAPLEIKSVAASCGCTAAVTKDKVIKPGASGEIEVTFDTQGRPGKNVKTVMVSSNDPRTPSATLTINVQVERQLGLEPQESYLFGQAGQKVIAEAWLGGKLAAQAKKLKVAKMDPPGPVLVALIDRKTEGGAVQRGLRFENSPKHAGSGTVRVVLDTGLPDPPQITHLVRWSVKGNLEVPDAVVLDLSDPMAQERVIEVSSSRGDFRLKSAKVVNGPFKAELLTGIGSPVASIKITTILTSPLPTPATGKLLLESNDPLQPSKEITLSLEARRAGGPR